MRVKLTLDRDHSSIEGEGRVDILVTVDARATVGDLADALRLQDSAGGADPAKDLASTGALTVVRHVFTPAGSWETQLLDRRLPVVESGLRSGARVSLAQDIPADGLEARGPAVAVLRLLQGPGAGSEFPLHEGANFLGRGSGNDLVLVDPMISKRHARISVTSLIDIVDLGSVNGIVVDGHRVQRATLTADNVVTLGDTSAVVLPLKTLTGASDSAVDFNRPPLVRPIFAPMTVEAPEPPQRPQPFSLPFLSIVAPLFMGAALYLITRQLVTVVFMGLSPLLVIGSLLDQRRNARKMTAREVEEFNEALKVVGEEVQELQYAEIRSRLMESPSTTEAVECAERLSSTLWMRRPDVPGFLTVRLGLGTVASRVTLETPKERPTIPEARRRLKELIEQYRYVTDVPIVGDLRAAGGVGVAGSGGGSWGLARSVVLQLVCHHSPAELAVVALGGASSAVEWDWLKWLPHVNSGYSSLGAGSLADSGPGNLGLVNRLEELIALRLDGDEGGTDEPTSLPAVLVVVMDDAPVERSRIVQIAERGPRCGVHVLWVAGTVSRIPACCRAFIEDRTDGLTGVGLVHEGLTVTPVTCETVSLDVATHVARRLSPIVDSGARLIDDSDLPRSVSFLSTVGREFAESPDAVLARWRANDPTFGSTVPVPHRQTLSLRGPVGQAVGESMYLDLRTHGPHALVGGTTGAGKSEFLQSWVLGMASHQSPQRLNFLFVDYKGGSAFANCLDLPHCVGLVTDLSPYLVRRALTSFRAELRHRERVLEERGGRKDLIDLERSGDPYAPPSLIIIVDEFAALVQEVPEFIDGVVDVGQRGRSLGLHLILATQQPAGVIKGSLRANTNLRIALRMADPDDSLDVLGDPIAASFDPDVPGRGAAKTGPGRITQFQSLYAGGLTSAAEPTATVDIETLGFGLPTVWSRPHEARAKDDIEDTDIARVVTQVQAAYSRAGLKSPRKPWLEVLSPAYDLASMRQTRDSDLKFGIEDDPAQQAHRHIAFRPDDDGNMAVFGTGGSGKSTLLRTLALAAAITPDSGPCDVYGLDFGSRGLSLLDGMPHVGAVISGDDHERIARLIRWLRQVIDDRSARYSAAQADTITEYRRRAQQPAEKRILLLVDGMASFREEYEMSSRMQIFNQFGQICSEGRPVGIHVVMSGERPNVIPTSIGATVQRRVFLRLADDQDYAMAGEPSDVLSSDSVPGRCVFRGLEAQVATLGGTASLPDQAKAAEELARVLREMGREEARPIERLREQVDLGELPPLVDGGVVIGLRDDTLGPQTVLPSGTFLVVGPPGSGRTTALATIAQATRRALPGTRAWFFGHRRSALSGLMTWEGESLDEDTAIELAASLEAAIRSGEVAPSEDRPVMVLIDQATNFFNGAAESVLQSLVETCESYGVLVLSECETSAVTSSYALGHALRAARRGIALQPEDIDGTTVFRTTLPRMGRGEFPPGRGALIERGKFVRVQVALPEL